MKDTLFSMIILNLVILFWYLLTYKQMINATRGKGNIIKAKINHSNAIFFLVAIFIIDIVLIINNHV